MVKLLQDIWILADSGIVLFHRVFNEYLDAQIFGGLMTALNSFAEQLSTGGLSNFELNNIRFSVIKQDSFLFIANSPKEAKVKKVHRELNLVAEKFLKLYPKETLNNFSGNVKKFRNFKKEIESSLKKIL